MTISRSHIINEQAENIFKSTLPASWLKRKQDPDHHIDYFVEVGQEGSSPSGHVFGVQLKGRENLTYSSTFASQPLETECIRYYLEDVQQPVFLVVVDVRQNSGFWIFLQEWTVKELRGRDWRKQKTLNVRVPFENRLEDAESLHAAVIESERFMRNLRPGCIEAALNAEKVALEALDERFNVTISHVVGRTQYEIQPQEEVDIKVSFRTNDPKELRARLSDLVDRGLKAEFNPKEVVFHGSELIRRIADDPNVKSIEICPTRKREAELILTSIDTAGNKCGSLVLHGSITLGRKEGNFRGVLSRTPLDLSLAFPVREENDVGSLQVTFEFDTTIWEGHSLLTLPYFDRLASMFGALRVRNDFGLALEIDGYPILSGTVQAETLLPQLDGIVWYLRLLEKARVVASKLGIDPHVPEDAALSEEDVETVTLLYQVLSEGEYRLPGAGVRFSCNLVPSEQFFEVAEKGTNEFVSVGFQPRSRRFNLFGTEFGVGWLKYWLTKASWVFDVSRIQQVERSELIEKGVELECIGAEGSELVITICTEKETEE